MRSSSLEVIRETTQQGAVRDLARRTFAAPSWTTRRPLPIIAGRVRGPTPGGSHDASDDRGDPGRTGGHGRTGHRRGLGPHPARFEGRILVRAGPRWVVLRPDPGRRRGVTAE